MYILCYLNGCVIEIEYLDVDLMNFVLSKGIVELFRFRISCFRY